MPSHAAAVHDAAEIIHSWMAESAPLIQTRFADVQQWDRDTLIRRYCMLRAHLRDTSVRTCDVPPPPPNADLAWWRMHVANPADTWALSLWTDPTALPRLLIDTQDVKVVHVLTGLLIGFFFVCCEYDERLEAQQVSRRMRVFCDDPLAVRYVEYVQLLELIGEKRESQHLREVLKRDKTVVCEANPSEGLVGLFKFLEKEGRQGQGDADDYTILAAGPLSVERCPTVQQWERVAGDLLAEDIRRCERAYRALLTPDLDVKARGAARDAARGQYRAGLALERGGPGTVEGMIAWRCDCNKIHKRNVAKCQICNINRPDHAPHVSFDGTNENGDTDLHEIIPDPDSPTPEQNIIEQQEHAFRAQRLANIQAQLPATVLAAFKLIADGEAHSLTEAAKRVQISEKTLRRWRTKVRGKDPI